MICEPLDSRLAPQFPWAASLARPLPPLGGASTHVMWQAPAGRHPRSHCVSHRKGKSHTFKGKCLAPYPGTLPHRALGSGGCAVSVCWLGTALRSEFVTAEMRLTMGAPQQQQCRG